MKEAEMKRALMRGVCALNMEAMSVFRDKTMISDPSKSAVSKQVLANVSDPLFQAVIIPKYSNVQGPDKLQEQDSSTKAKITRVLVTRHS